MFHPVLNEQEIDEVAQLAQIIWTEHYSDMLGKDQVAYMLSGFHSRDAIALQIRDESYQYFLIRKDGAGIGYIGLQVTGAELFLSKLYVLSTERGSGVGRQSLQFIDQLARDQGADTVALTVYKHNVDSIAAYKRLGFVITGGVHFDIGSGYVMDDYRMERPVSIDP